jgi:hypothetical protein
MVYNVIKVVGTRNDIDTNMQTAIQLLSIKSGTMPSTALVIDGSKILALITYEVA